MYQNFHINFVEEGHYFGEVGLITNLQRTATATSNDYCTLSSMSNEVLQLAKEEYPIIFDKFRDGISKYVDFDFIFRQKMVKNIPYFRNLENSAI